MQKEIAASLDEILAPPKPVGDTVAEKPVLGAVK